MTSRPGRKIARAQAHREKNARPTLADRIERRRRSSIIMGVIGLLITVGVVTALVVSRNDSDEPEGVPAATPDTPSTTALGSGSTTVVAPDESTTTVVADGSTTTAVATS